MKIEYQQDTYPAQFSENALNYIERTNLPRRMDGEALGVRETTG